ncbi:zinc finger Y-chromosomal protein 2-like [Sitophilus oryzae]|uniref:Zinc finger Y-chromosomal protein 2-like n=1 Tax=Sitophilus oryzae TaxID=7048 RepID=A0A6J2Y7P2_SITOR|nr:zinc finger Y-chromosomal protein 2-like [Sitophilus oryzae]
MDVKISMGEEKTICRTCLKLLDRTGFMYLDDENGYIKNVGNIREILQFCIPELDLYVSSEPVICYQCLHILVQVYNFKMKCLNIESSIRTYITRHNLIHNQVNLNLILREEIVLKKANKRKHTTNDHIGIDNSDENVLKLIEDINLNRTKADNAENLQVNYEDYRVHNMEVEVNSSHIGNITEKNDEININNKIKECNSIDIKLEVDMPEDRNLELVDKNEKTNIYTKNTNCINSDPELETNEHQNLVVVRKDLFDRTKTKKTAKQSILNSTLIPKNGHIILKINRNRIEHVAEDTAKKNDTTNKASLLTSDDGVTTLIPNLAISSLESQNVLDDAAAATSQNDPNAPVFSCSKCSYLTSDIINMYDHNRNFHTFEYTCQHCPFSTSKVELLGKHMNSVHPELRNYSVSDNYACGLCPFSVKSIDLLRSHHLTAHRKSFEESEDGGPIILNSAFSAEGSSREAKIFRRLQYSCGACDYATKDKSNLRKHLFTHGTKPVMCDHCNYKCISPYQLRRHLKQKHVKQSLLKRRAAPYELPALDEDKPYKVVGTLKKKVDN